MQVDLAIVGAGPAGMAAAIAARSIGLDVAVFDDQPTPGGQVYRNITGVAGRAPDGVLGADYLAGLPLAERFLNSDAAYVPNSTVWRVAEDGVSWSSRSGGGECRARRILVATGAMERPFPTPGWTLPGVMTAGSAQILLKTAGIVADHGVFVGCGPLLYLTACQYLKAGARVRAILDTADPANRLSAMRHLPHAARAPGYLAKGLALLAQLVRSGVPYHRNVHEVELLGTDRLTQIRWSDGAGGHEIGCEHAFLHQGVIPNVNTTFSTDCAHLWDGSQLSWRPALDPYGRSSRPWLLVAGDGGGISGARSAALSGKIAALTVAFDLGRLAASEHERRSGPLLAARRRDQAIRPFLERLYRPADAMRIPGRDDAVICRCEEVRRRDLVAAVAEGCVGPNQLKSFTRAGMGPCQGRLCGHTVVESIADLRGTSPAEIGYFRIRTPLKPVTVGEIAGLTQEEPQS